MRSWVLSKVAPSETISIVYHLLPLVPGHVLLPKVTVVPVREQVRSPLYAYFSLTGLALPISAGDGNGIVGNVTPFSW